MKRYEFNVLRNEAGDEGDGGGDSGDSGDSGVELKPEPAAEPTPGSLVEGEPVAKPDPATAEPQPKPTQAGQVNYRDLIGEDGNFKENWTENLPDHLKDKASHFSKYKSMQHALEHTHNLQQLLGKKSDAMVIPAADAPREEWDPVLRKLGVPETPEDYGLKAPEGLPEGVSVDEEELKGFASMAHEIGLTKAQVAKLQEYDVERSSKNVESSAEQAAVIETKHFAEQKQILQKEWGTGQQFTENAEMARRAALTFGLSKEEVQDSPLMRNATFVKLMANAGKAMSEDKLVAGGGEHSDGGLKAKAKSIINDKSNPDYEKYRKGDPDTVTKVQGWLANG